MATTPRKHKTARNLAKRTTKLERLPKDRGWPAGYVESFSGFPDDFVRPLQIAVELRRKR